MENDKELIKSNKELARKLSDAERQLKANARLSKSTSSFTMKLYNRSRGIKIIPFVLLSDWHVEETVEAESVNDLNEFNLDIADRRIDRLFNNVLRMLQRVSKDEDGHEAVICLLGDFISGNIHEELMEGNSLQPIDAIIWAQKRLISGINFLLAHTKLRFTVVCKSGNHSRITKKIHCSTEDGNSLEYMMYNTLAQHFEGNKRLKFIINKGYFSYLNVMGYTIRIHHGHALKFGGGQGGLFIPAYKAIGRWNEGKSAHLDLFAHFHQLRNGGKFICNGSLIGVTSYSLRSCGYEPPCQKFFCLTDKGMVVAEYPLFV